MHFVFSLSWDFQNKLRYILCLIRHWSDFVNSSLVTFCALSSTVVVSKQELRSFCDLSGTGGFLSTQVKTLFVSSLAKEGFGQYMMRCILWPRWLWGVWSTHVEMHFMFSLACFVFSHHKVI